MDVKNLLHDREIIILMSVAAVAGLLTGIAIGIALF
jgi:hypothetical protein